MLTLLLAPVPAAAPVLDLAPTLHAMLPALHAVSFSSLDFWSEAQLWQYCDEAARRLAQIAPVFVDHVADLAVVAPPTATYALPARTVATLHVALDGKTLPPASIPDMEARSQTWPADTGPVQHWLPDVDAGTLRLYPIPTSGGVLSGVLARYPVLSPAATQIRAPRPLRWRFALALLAAARGYDSPAAMPEVAQWAEGAGALLDHFIRGYWGHEEHA